MTDINGVQLCEDWQTKDVHGRTVWESEIRIANNKPAPKAKDPIPSSPAKYQKYIEERGQQKLL